MPIDMAEIKKDHDHKMGKIVEKFHTLLGEDPELQAFEAIYEEHDALQKREYEALNNSDCTLSPTGKLVRLLEITLGREGLEATESGNFKELGEDSLGAVAFSLSTDDIIGVTLSVDSLLSARWQCLSVTGRCHS